MRPLHLSVPAALALALMVACGGSNLERDDGGTDGASGDGFNLPDATPQPAFGLQFVDPDHGPFGGFTEVTVRGSGFDEGIEVLFGGRSVEPLDIEVIDERRLTVLTPPGNPGLADVEVRLDGESAILPGAFNYEAIKVDPDTGSVAGGSLVTIVGFGTEFEATTEVTFDGLPLTDITIINEQSLTGRTPPGIAGSADVRVITSTATHLADRAYTYITTADPFAGGMGGGPINGEVNVVVLDQLTDNGVDGAYVVIGDPATSPFQGFADDLGQITFSDPSLVGPITTTAAAEGFETSSFVSYDARDITIFLSRPPVPNPGPFPPPRQNGRLVGNVLFGDATGLGSPHWNLVPEPRTPTERKRVYVTTSAPTIFSSAMAPTAPIDYQGFDPDKVSWQFEAYARPSALAVVAIAGLYDSANDPSGLGVSGFEPFAMGVARGILVGPGENVTGIDVVINIPLDTAVQVDLDKPPARGTPGFPGPLYYTVRPFIDLGGEGVIALNKGFLPFPPPPEERPNIYTVADDEESIVLSRMAPLTGGISDASYSFIVGAYSMNNSNPFSIRVARGYNNVTAPVTVEDFLGVPRMVDPLPGGIATGRQHEFASEGPSDGKATFHAHIFRTSVGEPLMRVFTHGDVFQVPIPDISFGGLTPFPANEDVSWTIWSITVPGATFNDFNYRFLSSQTWNAYASDASFVQFP
jgi:hypothetical protein